MWCMAEGVWRYNVGGFAEGVLGGVCATYLDVELVTTIPTADDDRFSGKGSEWLQNCLAQLLKNRNILRRAAVVDVVGFGSCRTLEFTQIEMFS